MRESPPAVQEDKWKIEMFKDRLRHSLPARFLLRFHISLILLFTVFAGWVADLLLLRLGLTTMMWRYPLAVLAGYGAFLFGVRVWIEYSGIREYVQRRKAAELIGEDVPREPAERFDRDPPSTNWWDGPSGCLPVPDEGCLTVLVVGALLAVVYFLLGGYLVASASSFFAEVVVELLLAAGLLGGVRKYEAQGWMTSVVNYTYPRFIGALLVAFLIGLFAYRLAPQARTFADAWQAHRSAGAAGMKMER